MKSSWFGRCACAVFVLALGGCPDQLDDLGPNGDLPTGEDAGRSVEPVQSGEDASAREDATVVQDAAPVQEEDAHVRDAHVPDAHVEDAGSAHEDASSHDAGNGDAGSEPAPGSFASIYPIITESCTGCHGAGKPLDLSTPELAHAGLVGVEAKYPVCIIVGVLTPLRVVIGKPDESLLIAKLEGTQSCGKQMPPKALLEADKVARFRAWVEAGAPAQ